MNLLHRWLSSGRAREAARRVAKDPSARHYAELVQEHAQQGELSPALKVAIEGLRAFPGDAELKRLESRTREMLREGRRRELLEELVHAPRAGLWRELIEILIADGRVTRAEEVAAEWFQATNDGEAQLWRAQARASRFFADRRRDDGRLALELVAAARERMPGQDGPLRLQLELYSRIGAWAEARRVLARLLELVPGDQHLEARFRSVDALSAQSKSVEQALRAVEKSGRFSDEQGEVEAAASASPNERSAVRPLLQALSREQGVQAAFFVRGATALVQGPRGYTAERTARGVREILAASRSAARKLGLGQASEMRFEGGFGCLVIAPGELGAGAVWASNEQLSRRSEEALRDLAGIASQAREETR